jgi:hypothetical protein
MNTNELYDYYYGQASETFSFYMIPKSLITDKKFSNLSSDSKILYGLMLNRMSLSRKNNWFDEHNRAYIFYTVEQVMDDMSCSNKSAGKYINELVEAGLIEKLRQGQGKPSIIYVKNFLSPLAPEPDDTLPVSSPEPDDTLPVSSPESVESTEETAQDRRSVKSTLQDVYNVHFKKCKKYTSRSVKSTLQDVYKVHAIYNNINNTDSNNTDSIISNQSNHEILKNKSNSIDKIDEKIALIKKNISYDDLIVQHTYDADLIDEMVNLIADVCTSTSDTIRIGGNDRPVSTVISVFEKLRDDDIEYVLLCLHQNTSAIHNIKSYMLTTLYNARFTKNTFYFTKVNHDMYGT